MADVAISGVTYIVMRVSTDNGSNFDSAANYQQVPIDVSSSGDPALSGFPPIDKSAGNYNVSGYIDLYFNNIASANPTYASKACRTGGTLGTWELGIYKNQANVNAVRFTGVAGDNIGTGTIYKYGIS